MKPTYLLILMFFLISCGEDKKIPSAQIEKPTANISHKKITDKRFQQIINAADLNGVILIFDEKNNTFYSNDFERSEQGFLPASTFKIPNSIIALETKAIANENTIIPWDGKKRWLKIWEQDLTFKEAFQKSCLPCYQDIVRMIGETQMKEYLQKLDYPKMDFDTTSFDEFWVKGNSKITAMEQIDFLKRLYHSEISISARTEKMVKDFMVIDKNPNYKLSGKTGWSVEDDENLGWFVGYLEKGEDVYFLATNVDPKENFDMKRFSKIRLQIVLEALKTLEVVD